MKMTDKYFMSKIIIHLHVCSQMQISSSVCVIVKVVDSVVITQQTF